MVPVNRSPLLNTTVSAAATDAVANKSMPTIKALRAFKFSPFKFLRLVNVPVQGGRYECQHFSKIRDSGKA
jgi:hypothetical protein